MTSPIINILSVKTKMANNYIDEIKHHIWVHLLLAFFVMSVILGGGTEFFELLFKFLSQQEEFGIPLIHRLLGMVFMVFFSMLIFSNLIITLSTTYISRELNFLMSYPIKYRDLFILKFVESVIYSSWAFVLLTLPIFIGYGKSLKIEGWFYAKAFLLVPPFAIIPAGIGAILTMLIAAYFPARKARRFSVAMAIFVVAAIIILLRILGTREMLFKANQLNYEQIMNFLKVGSAAYLPHFWIAQGVIAAGAKEIKEYIFWLLMLTSTALMVVQVCLWMIPKYYYRGWAMTRETTSGRYTKKSVVFGAIDKLLFFLPRNLQALISKDMRTFWRDPAQWSQLIILFGLLFVYIANIKNALVYNNAINLFIPKWRLIISFFNMGAICFVLSILTTRFIFPMLSLEGKEFWIIGLSPMKRTRIVWEKYWLCWVASFIISESLMVFSGKVLELEKWMFVMSAITVVLMSFGLTSLAVGLSALMPNFREDNPARIANGLGGTLNVVFSLSYIGTAILLEIVYAIYRGMRRPLGNPKVMAVIYGFVVLNLIVIILPMYLGIRKWKKMEF